MDEKTAIQLDNVFFSYDDAQENKDYALNGVSLSVEKGEFVAVLGHNGSGKSTLARLIDGLIEPTAGKITVLGMDIAEGKNVYEVRKKVGLVFQNPDNQTVASIVEDDIAFGPENVGMPREEIGKRIEFALSAVGMEAYKTAMPNRLSGGQKQRVAIAGVLALTPEIMILDEATAMLDPKGRKEVISVVKKLNEERGITVLLITHFPEEALTAHRAIVMNRGEIVMQGKPEEILKREEELETYNLTLPKPVKLCRDLQRAGVAVEDTLSPEKLTSDILLAFGEKRTEIAKTSGAGVQLSDETVGKIVAKDLSYTYNENSPFATHALNSVSLTVNAGEFFGIIGHTGSGKSTFLQHLNALIKLPTAEKKYNPKKHKKHPISPCVLQVNGFDLTDKITDFKALRSKVGMVFQYPEYQLFADTVFEDVAFGLKNFTQEELTGEQIAQAVKDALETVGLDYEEVKDRSPFELSGGQKRRVAIAGVIVTKPQILVLDEPAAGLDPLGKEQIMSLLKKIHGDWCKTVVFVSHDMDEIAENCTRAAVFSGGEIVAEGTPEELFENPENIYALGLDAPFVAKVQALLKKSGVHLPNTVRFDGFAKAISEYIAKAKEGGNHA